MQEDIISNQSISESQSTDSAAKQTAANNVVACIDGLHFSKAVCDYACWISRKINAPLKLLHNIEQQSGTDIGDLSGSIGLGSQEQLLQEIIEAEQKRSKLLMASGREILNSAKEHAIATGVDDVIIQQRHGAFAETLSELETHVAVLVMGICSENRVDETDKVSTHIETIVRSLDSPILVVNSEFEIPKNILLVYDGSEPAQKALQMVSQSPLFRGLPCHLIYVSNDASVDNNTLQQAADQLQKSGLKVVIAEKRVGKTDKLTDDLCEYRIHHHIDMTVMGAFRYTRVRNLLLGSFTAKMLAKTQKPLLLLR